MGLSAMSGMSGKPAVYPLDYGFLTDGLIGAWGPEEIITGFTGQSILLEKTNPVTQQAFNTQEIRNEDHKTFIAGVSTRVVALYDQSGNGNNLTRNSGNFLIYRTSTDEYYEINGRTGISPVIADIRFLRLGTPARVRSAFFVLNNVPASTAVTGIAGNEGPNENHSYFFLRTTGDYQISVDGDNVSDLGAAVIDGGNLTAGGQSNFDINGSSIFPNTPTVLGIIMDALTQTDIDIIGALGDENLDQSSGPDTQYGAVLLYDTDKTADYKRIQAHLMHVFGIT